MNVEALPIGTVVKLKNNKLVIISGYITSTWDFDYDYIVNPYPFNCMNVKNNFKQYKKYEWFDFGISYINKNDIVDVIFMGYKGEEYWKIANEI